MRCADGPDFLAARHRLATTHENAAKMPIERVDVFDRAVLPISVPHNDHVSPAHVTVARENHHAGADTANRSPRSVSPPRIPSQSSPRCPFDLKPRAL